MVTRRDYDNEHVEAARSVLIELIHLLGEYREHIVVVGGWTPRFICPQTEKQHVGSLDVDVALDHREITDEGYRTIQRLLLDHGYTQGDQPFIFYRVVPIGGREIRVEVDLLGAEYEGTGRTHRTQQVQDVRLRKARGADLAFDAPVEVTEQGRLPDGATDKATLRVASVAPFLVMKAMALDARLKEKDSWDIYYCLAHFPGGIDRVIEDFKPYLGHGLAKEGLQKLDKHFGSVDSVGPTHVANFEELTAAGERDRLCRDAYERVNYLLEQLGIR